MSVGDLRSHHISTLSTIPRDGEVFIAEMMGWFQLK
jgi:hypothetical protein